MNGGADEREHDELRRQVDGEVHRLLESGTEIELAAVYRALVASMGGHVVQHIAETISQGLRSGVIAMESRAVRSDGPAVAFVRRVSRPP